MSSAVDCPILHVDMDAFFAAVEQLDNPELRDKPVLVGGSPRERGVVAAASYEARPFGCHSAMPMAKALHLCPKAIVVPPRFERYEEVSRRVFDVFEQFTPLVEPLSIDEAFLDVAGSVRLFGSPDHIARELKQRIKAETKLTASAGVAPNKFLAKLASDLQKPDGLVIVRPDQVQAFLDPMPISRLWGVGKATLPRFAKLGVRTFEDARRFTESELRERFGEAGGQFYRLVRGIDDRTVIPDREAKSMSNEITFPVDLEDHEYLRAVLLEQTEQVARRLRRCGVTARTITLKIRSGDFTTITRRVTLEAPTDQTDLLWQAVGELFDRWSRQEAFPVRLIGMGISQLAAGTGQQLSLFGQEEARRRRALDRTLDTIRDRFGEDAITRGRPPHAGEQGRR